MPADDKRAWTPGPWSVQPGYLTIYATSERDAVGQITSYCVAAADRPQPRGPAQAEANARLIAAAPAMYEALEWYERMLCSAADGHDGQASEDHATLIDDAGARARTALAQARGER